LILAGKLYWELPPIKIQGRMPMVARLFQNIATNNKTKQQTENEQRKI